MKGQLATFLLLLPGHLMAHDWLIVPGKRVGPVTSTSTEADLKAAFGAVAVQRAQIRIDGKTTAPGVEIYHGKPDESLAVVWPRSDGGLWWPLLVIPCYAHVADDCRWRTAEGVRVGMGLTELERLNERPLLLYPDESMNLWRHAWWDGILLEREARGKLATLGEDVELQFEMPLKPVGPDFGYVSSDEEPIKASNRPISRMLVYLLSALHRTRITDWTIGGPFWSKIQVENAELLRESLGPDAVRRWVGQGEEGIGLYPEIGVFPDQPDQSVYVTQTGPVVCSGANVVETYRKCRWQPPKPFAWIMTFDQLQKLNGRPFLMKTTELGDDIVTSWEGGKLEEHWPGQRPFVLCKGGYPDTRAAWRSDDPDLRKLDCSVLYVPQ